MYSRMLSLRFPRTVVDKPIVCHLASKFNLTFNILSAKVYPRQEGLLIMEMSGHRKNFNEGLRYLKEMGVKVESVGQDVRRDDEVCWRCGLCTSICPTGALWVKHPEMDVIFEADKCSGCELCVSVCPPRAMQVRLNRDMTL